MQIVLKFVLTLLLISYFVPSQSEAAVMESNSYKIPNDIMNEVGGTSTSSNYKLQFNMGEAVGGESSSGSYQLNSGYLEAPLYLLDFSYSIDTIDFGTLDSSSVSTAVPAVTLAITLYGSNGYTIYVKDSGNNTNPGLYNEPDNYLISSYAATLVAGTEGYGIQASSSSATIDAVYAKSGNDIGGLNISAQTLASNTTDVKNEQITVNTKAAISGYTPGGRYRDQIFYTCLMKF